MTPQCREKVIDAMAEREYDCNFSDRSFVFEVICDGYKGYNTLNDHELRIEWEEAGFGCVVCNKPMVLSDHGPKDDCDCEEIQRDKMVKELSHLEMNRLTHMSNDELSEEYRANIGALPNELEKIKPQKTNPVQETPSQKS